MRRGGVFFQPGNHIKHTLGVAVGGINEECVHARLDEGHGPLIPITEETNCCTGPQAPVLIFGGARVLLGFHKIFEGDQPGQFTGRIHQGQALNLIL